MTLPWRRRDPELERRAREERERELAREQGALAVILLRDPTDPEVPADSPA